MFTQNLFVSVKKCQILHSEEKPKTPAANLMKTIEMQLPMNLLQGFKVPDQSLYRDILGHHRCAGASCETIDRADDSPIGVEGLIGLLIALSKHHV